MSKENSRPGHTWGEEEAEEASPRTFRDAYLNAANQNRPQARSGGAHGGQPPETPRNARIRPRGVPGAGEVYEESDELNEQDPRTTRQAHAEALARVRQRPRYTPEQGRATPPASKPERTTPHRAQEYPSQPERPRANASDEYLYPPAGSRREPPDDYPYQQPAPGTGYGEDDAYEPVARPHHRPAHPPKQRRRGRAGSYILTGCLGGLLTVIVILAVGAYYLLHNTPLGQNLGKTTYTQQVNQTLPQGNASVIIVKNQVGNVSINVGSSVSSASVSSVRTVRAGSQSEAQSQFSKIVLSVQQISQGGDPACTASSCLLIIATLPANTGGGLFGGTSASMDLTLNLPKSFNSPDPLTPHAISASSTSGNLAVNGFNGIINLTGKSGKISVTHALIFAGTCLQTLQGDVNVGQGSIFDLSQPSNQIPCSANSSSGVHPWFNIKSGRGNVDLTLATPSTNLLLDANTNSGTITDDFGLNVPSSSDGSATYHGPLLLNSTPTASLYVFTNTGNIGIHASGG